MRKQQGSQNKAKKIAKQQKRQRMEYAMQMAIAKQIKQITRED